MYNVNCDGRCARCIEAHGTKRPVCPPEEAWAAERAYLRREYRIGDVWASLLRLASVETTIARAVWSLYVEPWPGDPLDKERPEMGAKTEPIAPEHREARAFDAWSGVEWMAHDIRGDVRAFGEKAEPIDNQIRQLASRGLSQRRIASRLHVGRDRIRRLLSNDPERSSAVYESAVSG